MTRASQTASHRPCEKFRNFHHSADPTRLPYQSIEPLQSQSDENLRSAAHPACKYIQGAAEASGQADAGQLLPVCGDPQLLLGYAEAHQKQIGAAFVYFLYDGTVVGEVAVVHAAYVQSDFFSSAAAASSATPGFPPKRNTP